MYTFGKKILSQVAEPEILSQVVVSVFLGRRGGGAELLVSVFLAHGGECVVCGAG